METKRNKLPMKHIEGLRANKRLQGYLTLAVSVIGVWAFPSSADAEVIYTKLDPEGQSGVGGVISFDFLVNANTITFSLTDIVGYGDGSAIISGPVDMGAGFVGSATEIVSGFPVTYAYKLAAGVSIGSTSPIQFFNSTGVPYGIPYGNLTLNAPPLGGPFLNNGPGYLGLTFQDGGNTYYGWARVEVDYSNPDGPITLFEYAYENTPSGSIDAGAVPEPSTLGLLAAGAVGLSALRRSRRRQADALS